MRRAVLTSDEVRIENSLSKVSPVAAASGIKLKKNRWKLIEQARDDEGIRMLIFRVEWVHGRRTEVECDRERR